MEPKQYFEIKKRLAENGCRPEIDWAENIKPCASALDFFMEYSWVVINSGMKEQVARKIWERILARYRQYGKAADVFGHKAKAKAIDAMLNKKDFEFRRYQSADDKLKFLQGLPWIGPITKYHLAKNLGHDCVKPDRHLVRIASNEGKTPDKLCRELSMETGDRLSVVDTVLWRAANLGML